MAIQSIHFLLIGTFVLCHIQIVNSIICYQCADCPEPFTENYPYVFTVNNTNFLAGCLKTVLNLGDGRRLISKGSVFTCPTQATSGDIQLYCCNRDYCNTSTHFGPSFLLLVFILIRLYF